MSPSIDCHIANGQWRKYEKKYFAHISSVISSTETLFPLWSFSTNWTRSFWIACSDHDDVAQHPVWLCALMIYLFSMNSVIYLIVVARLYVDHVCFSSPSTCTFCVFLHLIAISWFLLFVFCRCWFCFCSFALFCCIPIRMVMQHSHNTCPTNDFVITAHLHITVLY